MVRALATLVQVNELNNDIEKLEGQISEIKAEIEKYKGQGMNTENQRKKILKDLEDKLEKTEAKSKQYDEKYQAAQKTVNALKEGIQSIFIKIGCDKMPQAVRTPRLCILGSARHCIWPAFCILCARAGIAGQIGGRDGGQHDAVPWDRGAAHE
jgi:chaperonin cofactor prefoldin